MAVVCPHLGPPKHDRGTGIAARHVVIAFAMLLMSACLLFAARPVAAQEEARLSVLRGPDRSSPDAWIASFADRAERLESLLRDYQADKTVAALDAYAREIDEFRFFFDLDEVPVAFRPAVVAEAAAVMVDVFNRLPVIVSSEGANPDGGSSLPSVWAIPGTEIILVRQVEGADTGNYVLPPEVIAELPLYHELVMTLPPRRDGALWNMRALQANLTGPLFPESVARALSSAMDGSALGTRSWKLLVAVLGFVLTLTGNVALYRWVRTWTADLSGPSAALVRLAGPLVLVATIGALAAFCVTQLMIGGQAAVAVAAIRNLCVLFAAAWAALLLADLVTEWVIDPQSHPDTIMDADLARLVGKTVGIVIAIAIGIYGLGTIGVPTAGIITSLGVGGVGIAFATRVTMENLFGGFLLLIDRPFRIGDHIRIAAGEGVVLEIGLRSCRIRTQDGNILTIPNGALSASAITNIRSAAEDAPRV